jgi:hypothetical protein
VGYTYTGDPANNNQDAVRFLAGDVVETDWQVSDEEIVFALGQVGSNTYRAAALICDHLAARYSRETDEAVGDLKKTYSQRQKHYNSRAGELRRKYFEVTSVAPFVGGVSIAAKELQRDDSDWDQTGIRREGMDHPESDTST